MSEDECYTLFQFFKKLWQQRLDKTGSMAEFNVFVDQHWGGDFDQFGCTHLWGQYSLVMDEYHEASQEIQHLTKWAVIMDMHS